jgi:hypothetical protein
MVTLSLAEDSTTLRPHSTMSKMLEGDPKSQCRIQETERWKDEFILDHDGWVEFCVVSCILALNIFPRYAVTWLRLSMVAVVMFSRWDRR